MKQTFPRLLIAGIALLTVPSSLLAQKEKEEKDKKDKIQQIIITRTNNTDDKMVIEVDGDKVKVNGKDVKDNKDVNVHVGTMKGSNVYRYNSRNGNFDFNFNDDLAASTFYRVDDNRAMLGVNTEDNEKGAEISSVTKESGAEKAGLKKGDIITRIGDKKVEDADDLTEAIRDHKPGEKVTVTYLRDGKEQKSTAELSKWKGMNMNAMSIPRVADMNKFKALAPMSPSIAQGFGNSWVYGGRPKLGLSIQDTDDGIGVKVLDVDEEGNAAKAGLKKDDVILGIDDHEVKGTDDVTRLMRDNKQDKYTYNLKVKRDGKTQNMELKIPRRLKTADL